MNNAVIIRRFGMHAKRWAASVLPLSLTRHKHSLSVLYKFFFSCTATLEGKQTCWPPKAHEFLCLKSFWLD